MEQTKGEALIAGIDKIRDGLEMIAHIGAKQDLIKALIGSQAAANRLRDLVKSNIVFQNTVISMVASRNARLNSETVDKVITDFLDIMFDLSRPYQNSNSTTAK